jgi:hypothetical protein
MAIALFGNLGIRAILVSRNDRLQSSQPSERVWRRRGR